MTNEYKNVFWKLVPIALSILVALVGIVWGLTYGGLSNRVNRMDNIILDQSAAIGRIEAKLDILLSDRQQLGNNIHKK